jgi:hypothetical protein
VQNERLDRFHVKENMHQVTQDIQGGRILQVRMSATGTIATSCLQPRTSRLLAAVRQLQNLSHRVRRCTCVNGGNATAYSRFILPDVVAQAAADIMPATAAATAAATTATTLLPPLLSLLLQSMAIDKQTAALKEAITAPLLKAKDLLVKDIRDHDELLDEPE